MKIEIKGWGGWSFIIALMLGISIAAAVPITLYVSQPTSDTMDREASDLGVSVGEYGGGLLDGFYEDKELTEAKETILNNFRAIYNSGDAALIRKANADLVAHVPA